MATFLSGIQIWNFRGLSFAVRLTSTTEWDEWFEEDTIRTIEPVLDSNEKAVDIGGVTHAPVQRLIAFETPEERNAFHALRGQTGTLARPGESRTALLAKSRKVSSGTGAYYALDVTFEAV